MKYVYYFVLSIVCGILASFAISKSLAADDFRSAEEEIRARLSSTIPVGNFAYANGFLKVRKYDDGSEELSMKVYNLKIGKGQKVAIFVDNTKIGESKVNIQGTVSFKKNNDLPTFDNGGKIEVRYENKPVLVGKFKVKTTGVY